MKLSKAVLNHSHFNINDYEALSFKGYSNKEILKIWDRDKSEGKAPVTINKYTANWKEIRRQLELQAS